MQHVTLESRKAVCSQKKCGAARDASNAKGVVSYRKTVLQHAMLGTRDVLCSLINRNAARDALDLLGTVAPIPRSGVRDASNVKGRKGVGLL
jgi:hypothetical protein